MRALGDFLLHAESTGVWRVHAAAPEPPTPRSAIRLQPSTDLSSQGGCAIAEVKDENDANGADGQGLRVSHSRAGAGVLLGQFRLGDGRVAVLVQNHNWDVRPPNLLRSRCELLGLSGILRSGRWTRRSWPQLDST